ncbi:MAG: hypothetical protein PGN26_14410 [Xylophilus ampelinus]
MEAQLFLPSILVVAGWIIVNWQNDKRELRKEARSNADAVKKTIIEVAEKGVMYWTNSKEDESYKLTSTLDQIEVELQRFPIFKQGGYLASAFIAFGDAITDGNFESASRTAVLIDDQRIRRIYLKRNELMRTIEQQFIVHYL